jgi:hypothetical protein
METQSIFNIKGKVNIKLLDEYGNIKSEQTVNNLVVDTGLNFILNRMKPVNVGGAATVSRTSGSTTATVTTVDNHGLTTGDSIFAEANNLKAQTVDTNSYTVTVTGLKTFTIQTTATTTLSSVPIRLQFPASMTHMAIGTGTGSPASGNVALTANAETQREVLTDTIVSGKNITFTGLFPAIPNAQTVNITEAGIFNNSVGGVMLCRSTFSPVAKGASDSIAITWVITLGV